MMGMGGMMMFGWMLLIPLAVLALIGLGAYYLVTKPTGTDKTSTNPGRSAVEILKERYARGEITRDQYNKMKEEIEK